MHLKIETGQKGREKESESEHVINFLLRGKANSFSVYRERALWHASGYATLFAAD